MMDGLAEVLGEVLPLVVGLIVMAGMVESYLEFLVVPALKQTSLSDERRALVVKWVGALVGVLGCAVFGIDWLSRGLALLGVAPVYAPVARWFGVILTGFLVARGAQGIHDFAVAYLGLDGGSLPPFEEGGRTS